MIDTQWEKIYEDILDRINRLPVIDTHEHFLYEKDFVRGQYDFTHLMTYLRLDIGIAGFPCDLWLGGSPPIQEGADVADKWQRIKPFWPHVRQGLYGRHYRRMLKRFFNADDLTDETVPIITDKIKDYQFEGVYRKVLNEQYHIRVMMRVQDGSLSVEPQYFANACFLDAYLDGNTREEATKNLGLAELPVKFDDYLAVLLDRLRHAPRNGAVAFKIGWIARRRPLDFTDHTPEAVEAAYRFYRNRENHDWRDETARHNVKPFQDAAYLAAIDLAGELGLPVQIHSGLEFPQPWDGRPSCLIPTLLRFPQTKFAFMHGSYPYLDELTGLARSFPNVYIDLAWLHMLSQVQTRVWLAEWLDVIPHNKIFAFGGDELMLFGCATHLELARENIAHVLAQRVATQLCDLDEAEAIAKKLFHDNPWTTFAFKNWNPPGGIKSV